MENVLLIKENGEKLNITREHALEMADNAGLDLIQLGTQENSAVCKIGYLIISAFMIVVSSLIASDVYNISYVFSNRQYRIQGDLLSIEDMVMITIMVVNMIVSMGVMFNLVYKTVANQISAFIYHKVIIILGVAAINSVGDTLARIDELLYGNLDILTPNFDAISNTILALAWLSVMQLNYRVHRRNSSIAVKNVKKYKLIYIDSLVESILSILPTLVASILLIVMYDTEVYNASIGVSIICSTIVVLGILSLERNMFGTFRNFCRDNKIAINITEAIRGITEVAIMNYGIVSISQAVVDDGTGLSIIATIANMICTMILLAKQYGNIKAYNEISSTYVVTYSISVVASVIWCISIDSILIPFGMLVLAVGSFVLGYMMINKEKIYNKQINKG